jgi:hypothetical protein
MTRHLFEDFKDFILEKNKYFTNGYSNAFLINTDETQGIFSMDGDFIFPSDIDGNFFYLRHEANITFTPDISQSIADCDAGRMGFNDVQTVYLVAVVDEADEYALLSNLRNTAMMYNGFSAIPTSGILIATNTIIAELSPFGDKVVYKALQNLNEQAIVRLTLQITKPYVASKCINNPCKSC